MARFDNKVVVITGAAAGIGQVAAQRFAAEGASLVLVDRDAEQLQASVRQLELDAARVLAVPADVADDAQVQAYVDAAVQRFGRIDVFFNNAGISGAIAPLAEYPLESFDALVAVNLRGAFLGLQKVLQVMLRQGAGAIVNNASIGGMKGMPNTSAYNATKFALIGLTRTAAVEYSGRNIRVNAVSPAPTNTAMMQAFEHSGSDAREQLIRMIPAGRYGEPQEVVAATLFLASDEASFISGVILPIDGAMTAF